MNQAYWSCCGKNYVPGITKCRKCGKPKPVLGIVETKQKRNPPHGKIDYEKENKRDPLIGTEERIAVSTLKMKD